MDLENVKSWVSQPDVCRCCLSTSGTFDVTASYNMEAGSKEVYSNMLQECYGIWLSYLTEWGPSRMVCALCVGHLKDACRFRKQVEEAERYFVTYCGSKKDIFHPETNTELDKIPDNIDSPYSMNIEDDSEDDNKDILKADSRILETKKLLLKKTKLNKTHSTTKRKRQKLVLKGKRKRNVDLKEDTDSDTPLSEFSKKNVPTVVEGKEKNEITDSLLKENEIEKGLDTSVDEIGFQHTRVQNTMKQVRKRIRLTFDTVLRDTTACPFRHHNTFFQCFFCRQDFVEINLLKVHMLKTHADIDVEIKKIKRLPRSLQIEISNLECRQCNLNLTDVISMCRHFVEVHKKFIYKEYIADYKVDVSPYSCHICDKQFHVFRTLTIHLNEHYANCICDVCGKSYLNSKRLKLHKQSHENGNFPCVKCGKIFKNRNAKAGHMDSTHTKRVIKCQICFKPMKHYNERIRHMSQVHNITYKFKCPICGLEFNIKHYLCSHIRRKHGKPFNCDVCCKSFTRSYTLRKHMRTHDNEKQVTGTDTSETLALTEPAATKRKGRKVPKRSDVTSTRTSETLALTEPAATKRKGRKVPTEK